MSGSLTGLSIGVPTSASVLYAVWSGIVGTLAVMIDGASIDIVSFTVGGVGAVSFTVETVNDMIVRSVGTVASTVVLMLGIRKRFVESVPTEGSLNLSSVAAFGKIGSRFCATLLLRVVRGMVSRRSRYFPGHRIVLTRRVWFHRVTSFEEGLLRRSSGTIVGFDWELASIVGDTFSLLMAAMKGTLRLYFLQMAFVNRLLRLWFGNAVRLCNIFREPFVDGRRTGTAKVGIQRMDVIGLVHDRDYRFVHCCNRDFMECLVGGR